MKRKWQLIPFDSRISGHFINWLSIHFEYALHCQGGGWHKSPAAGFGVHRSTDDYTGTSLERLQLLIDSNRDWIFGHFGYNLKSETENISTKFPNKDGFSDLFFFIPEIVIIPGENTLNIAAVNQDQLDHIAQLARAFNPVEHTAQELILEGTTSSGEYIERCKSLLNHIHRGDIYEVNYCIDFAGEISSLDAPGVYEDLSALSDAPFSALYRNRKSWLMCASPERFLRKSGNILISQPIKGTRRRSINAEEDNRLKTELAGDPKERSENIMIVDLVRNDLSRVAKRGTVEVTELCGIHSFKTVHQMISTVQCELNENVKLREVIAATFPMGSMTGAPKISAMKLAEQHEKQSRGIYSGSVGFITPDNDFDFNVVIRSITWNSENGYLSAKAGGAITSHADPKKEYEECLIKAEAMMNALKTV